MKTNKNGVKLLAAVLVFAMAFAGCAVAFSDSEDAATSDDTTYLYGTIAAGTEAVNTQTFGGDSKVVVTGNLTIPKNAAIVIEDNASFVVNEGCTVTIQAGGQLVFNGANISVSINGSIVAEGAGKAFADVGTIDSGESDEDTGEGDSNEPETITFAEGDPSDTSVDVNAITINETTKYDSKTKVGISITGSIILNKGAKLTGETGIITILAGGSIEINNKNSLVSVIENQTIYMAEGVTFTMSGTANDITIEAYTGTDKYYQTSTVKINESGTGNTNYKTLSNIVIKTVVEKNQAIDNSNTGKVTMKNYIMDISGSINGVDTVEVDKGKIGYNGNTITAYYEVGTDGSADESAHILPAATIKGTLDIDETGVFAASADVSVTVSGVLNIAYDEDKELTINEGKGRFGISGIMIVTGNVSANWNSIAEGDLRGSIYIDGGKVIITDFTDPHFDEAEDCRQTTIGQIYAAFYFTQDAKKNSLAVFCDLKTAISEAVAEEIKDVYVYAGAGSEDQTSIDGALDNEAYVVEDGTVIPKDITLNAINALYVPEGSTLTFEVGSAFEYESGENFIFVDGKVIDNDNVIDKDIIFYQVSKYNEDTNVTSYTTLAIALSEAASGEVITLVNEATIDKTVTIGPGITVQVGEEDGEAVTVLVTLKGELVVNGILNVVNGVVNVEVERDGDDAIVKSGKITVNNIVMVSDPNMILETTPAQEETVEEPSQNDNQDDAPTQFWVAGFYTTEGKVGDLEGDYFILAPSVAAANSTTLGDMAIMTKTTYSGDLVFVAGEESDEPDIIIFDSATFGKITLNGFGIVIGPEGTLTATIGADVTSGYSAVKLDKVSTEMAIYVLPEDFGEEVTTTFVIETEDVLAGNMIIVDGNVYLDGELSVGNYDEDKNKSILTIASDANLIVMKESTLTVIANNADKAFSGLVVDGALTVESEGTFAVDAIDEGTTKDGMAVINGTLTLKEDQTIDGQLIIIGTLVVDVVDEDAQELTIDGALTVGKAPTSIGVNGTVVGILQIGEDGTLLAYPGADMSKAVVNPDAITGESKAIKTDYVIEGMIYLTVYGNDSSTLLIPTATIEGYEKVTEWYAKEDFSGTKLTTDDLIVDNPVVYGKAIASTAYVQVSVGTGMSLWIDGVKYTTGDVKKFNVGEYNVEVTINPGYKGTSKILFNGVQITNGKMIVTPEMSKTATTATNAIILSAIGDITIDSGDTPAPVKPTEKDDGMGITDYLLIVLVVLAAILVVIVAVRMMRS